MRNCLEKKELDNLKRIFILALAAIMLCSCGAPAKNDNTVTNEVDTDVSDDGEASGGIADEEAPEADETSVKTVRYDFDGCTIGVTVLEGWNYYAVADDGIMELQHVGIQLYDGEAPEQKEMYGGKLFVAVAANGRASTHVDAWTDMGTQFTEEAYTCESGAGMKLYYLDGRLDYATFDDYSELCVFFNLDDGDRLDDILKIVDTVKYESKNGEVAAPDEDAEVESFGVGSYWNWREDYKTRPDGKEVTIFADNTSDCDYSGYKKIGYGFGPLQRSVMAPEGWNGFRFYSDYEAIENLLTGIPIYDGDIPVRIDYHDESTFYDAMPMEKSTFFLAESPWMRAQDFIDDGNGLIDKFDHETYTDKKGRTMQVYFIDGLPRYACYDDYYGLCIWFNLKSEEQIPIVVNMINSVDVSLSRDAEWALKVAERFGYTIIPPEE